MRPRDDRNELRAPREPRATKAPGATILLADDDHVLRRALREELEAKGYDVSEAPDGASALELLAAAADGGVAMPDVLVLDVRMPGLSGLGVLEAMRRLPRPPVTIVVTGFVDRSIQVFASRFGARRVLHKPVDLDELLGAVLDAACDPRRGATG
jgi:CheY-like chemotaxis protein